MGSLQVEEHSSPQFSPQRALFLSSSSSSPTLFFAYLYGPTRQVLSSSFFPFLFCFFISGSFT